MQARTLLAIVATLQLAAICLNFTLAAYVIWLTLPFAVIAFLGVFIAIYCGWRTGIWIFIGCNAALIIYNIVMLFYISMLPHGITIHILDFTWSIIQLCTEILCVALAIWVLIELSYEDSKKDDEERKPLWGKK